MDIIVTIPKSEFKTMKKEQAFAEANNGEVVEYWSVGEKPTKLEIGDKVYFVEDGQINCYQIFLGYEYNAVCEVTDRVWKGLNLILEYPPIILDNPIPMKGFQGFRYVREDL